MTPPLPRPLPPPITDVDRARIKRNNRVELWICLGVVFLLIALGMIFA